MCIQGDIQSFGVLELFSILNQMGKTGVLSIISESTQRLFLFREGELVYASANEESKRLGYEFSEAREDVEQFILENQQTIPPSDTIPQKLPPGFAVDQNEQLPPGFSQ